ncbi:ribonuclease D [Roseospirillum parvum]|uniref:Ribonuclease D n=1 Tax=Roseospirillum parvum TaxID=83401 RepID=A0A1G8CY28_9PROT|nr:ribonuclease D [Roseospirillum parvum]SDH50487.1 ribonuclease D [Roseospirillum parvum]
MPLISDTDSLAEFCDRLAQAEMVTVDTEFLRDSTYWPRLCLVQMAGPDEARCIDALAEGIDLAPLFDLMKNEAVLKVFHAARQDLEIFFNLMGEFPRPLFDTQLAAMVCGFGDQVGYETLVKRLMKVQIDKSSRFTDWSHRPLTDRQITYALGDVTHLRGIHRKLANRLEKTGRAHWVKAELDSLTNPEAYLNRPEDAWKRLKAKSRAPRFLAVLRELAAWREREAQSRDMPRQRLVKDDALLEVAAQTPRTVEDLARVRALPAGVAKGRFGPLMIEAVARGLAVPEEDCPEPPPRRDLPPGLGPMVDLLKVLLKMRCEENQVAHRLIANTEDLEAIAADDNADVPALTGWRREVFGHDALDLKHGRLALAVSPDGKHIEAVELDDPH